MITPVVLTYNEEPNIETALAALKWAPRVVVLDSCSTDRTEQICRSFSNVSWFERKFDDHGSQWQYAIKETSIETEFVLALDADMRPGEGFQDELHDFLHLRSFGGAWVPFEYRVLGRPLRGSIYPPQIRIFSKDRVRIDQPGHTQIFRVARPLYRFRTNLIHEDRKPVCRWLSNQLEYAALEARRIGASTKKSMKDRVRLTGLSPAVWGAYAYFKSGGPFNNKASRAYACERLIFEALLARMLAEQSAQYELAPVLKHDQTSS